MPQVDRAGVATPAKTPAVAKVADAAAIVLFLSALSAAIYGGFRFNPGPIRISMTSPMRLALMAVAILAVRHWFVRREPLHSRLLQAAPRAWRSADVRAAFVPFVATRVIVLVVAYFAVATIRFPVEGNRFRMFDNEWLNLPARWDAGWYLSIAADGYDFVTQIRGQQSVAFFPVYPAVMRFTGALLGARPSGVYGSREDHAYRRTLLLAGWLASLTAFFWALIYLFRLARDLLDDERAHASVLLLAAYPFALFYSAAYTESLFLLVSVAAVYHLRRDELVAASVWGLLAGLTRPNGFLVTVLLGLMILEGERGKETGDRTSFLKWAPSNLLVRLGAAAMPVVGMLLFTVYLYSETGQWFLWAQAQGAWGRTFRGVTTLVSEHYRYLSHHGFERYTADLPIDILNGLGVVLTLALVSPMWRRFGVAFPAYVAVTVLPPLFAGGLLSMGRVTSVLFPTFLTLATLVPARHLPAWTAAFAFFQALAAVLFFTWRGLY